MRTATLDTNVFPAAPLIERARLAGIEASLVSVSVREVEGSTLEAELAALQALPEVAVWNEFQWNHGNWAGDGPNQLERALRILSNGSFPPEEQRNSLTVGQRRQLRDAIILVTHVREHRDMLVSNDRRAFIDHGRRDAIEAEFGTRVLTLQEFEQELSL